jgi:hypothetical protein
MSRQADVAGNRAGAEATHTVYETVPCSIGHDATVSNLRLFPGERLLGRWKANAVVSPDEHGLSEFAAGDLLWAVGMAGKEAIGGHLHLTSLRVAFVAHRFNRLRGTMSIPLPLITQTTAWRRMIVSVGIALVTPHARYEFVTWSRSATLLAVAQARDSFGPREAVLLAEVDHEVQRALEVNRPADAINVAVAGLFEITGAKPTALEALSLLNHLASARRKDGS